MTQFRVLCNDNVRWVATKTRKQFKGPIMGRVLAKRFFGNTNTGGLTGDGVASIAVGGTNTGYVAVPAMVIDAPTMPGGVQATAAAHLELSSVVSLVAGGSGYVPAQTLTLTNTGGTGTAGTLTVATTRIETAAVGAAAGTGYVPGDTVKPAGATEGTAPVITVNSTKVVSAITLAAGTGYAPADVLTVSNVPGVGTQATATVTRTKVVTVALAAGMGGDHWTTGDTATIDLNTGVGTAATVTITAAVPNGPATAVTFLTAGSYTTNPALLLDAPCTKLVSAQAGATGLKVDIIMGVETVSLLAAGAYTTNPTLAGNATTSATGIGATMTLVMGVNAITLTTKGALSANPTLLTNSTTAASTGQGTTGTGFTTTVTVGLLTVTVGAQRGDWTVLPTNIATATATGGGTGATFNVDFRFKNVAVTLAGAGYAVVPVVADNPNGNATFVATLTTTGENAIVAHAYTGAGIKLADIVKQTGSRRYRVNTSDTVISGIPADCYLKATVATALTQMNIKAWDAQGCLYYVTKLTRHHAVLTQVTSAGTGYVWATGAAVNWWFDAADATHCLIENA